MLTAIVNPSVPVTKISTDPVMGALKVLDVKMTDVKLTDQMTGHENAGREKARHEIAGHKRAGYETDSEVANV